MSGFLLDTNVLSELRKQERCNPGVRKWFSSVRSEELFLSVLVLGEIRQGIERIRLRDPDQAKNLEKWLQLISTHFSESLIPLDEKIADQWGRLGARQPIPVLDGLLAATAIHHDLTLVTRDESGFHDTGAPVLNPFSKMPGN
ncbi:MAG TPA: type II toxin-antitoxin system VapC family toxin [Candidatus Saccharimonadales bacterium]|nr:type II toxin-antitoxin system VapC family toxin [Candidatus Saccharimonadales bacterium]